jgi:hypothetical protein
VGKTFNLKKKAQQDPNFGTYVQTFLSGVEQAETLPTDDAMDMLRSQALGLDANGIVLQKLDEILQQKQEAMEQTQNIQQQIVAPEMEEGQTAVMKANNKKDIKVISKPFNLKKQAQIPPPSPPMAGQPPMDDMGLNDTPEIKGDQLDEQSAVLSIPQPPFEKMEDFKKWADETDDVVVLQALTTFDSDDIKEQMEQYFSLDDEGQKGVLAARIFNDSHFPLKKEQGFMADYEHYGEVTNIIKKLASECTKEYTQKEVKPFNLTKTAQHKTMESVIQWGPAETRKVDPFSRQPISDWHIIERNKGFGLVVDDVWNIDYETIWRENVMDKYSRPYKDKEGNWVGGYLQKRFEIDKNIPDTTNLQLKPGEKRRPILPEYGNTESRLQAARAKGDIEGANNTTEPFNWKEASTTKKKS